MHSPLGSAGLAINFDRLSGRWCHFHHNKLPSFDKFSNPYGTQITVAINELLCRKNAGAQIVMDFSKNKGLAPMTLEKIKFGPIFEVNGLDWQAI